MVGIHLKINRFARLMKIVNILLIIMFLGFSYLQLNDPDPVIWILIYGSMAAVCAMAAFRFYFKPFMLILAIGYIIYCIILWPGVSDWLKSPDRSLLFDDIAKMQFPYIEETREFLGLLICLAVLGLYWYRSSKKAVR